MAWSIIRRYTEDDRQAVEKAAKAFWQRHPELKKHIDLNPDKGQCSYRQAIEYATSCMIWCCDDNARFFRKLWIAAFRRATGEPSAEGVAWGQIGSHSD